MGRPEPDDGRDPGRDPAGVRPLVSTGPTVLRIALGMQLRRLREDRGISREAAGEAIRGSHVKISRLERARVKVKERDLADLLTRYGVTDPAERDQLLTLAQQASTPGWWQRYHDVLPDWFETYLGLEQAAETIRTYEVQFIPGLLQTADYARAVVMLAHGNAQAEEIDRRVALRMRRQDILTNPEPPAFWTIIDEAALRRPYGGPDVMRAQLRHLIDMAEQPHITIQVARYEIGGHAAAGGPFTVLRFPQPDLPDIVYLEQLTSALYLDKRRDLDQYLEVMNKLSIQATRPDATPDFLRTLLEQL